MERFWGLGWFVGFSLFVAFLFIFVLINLTGTKMTVQRAGTFFFFKVFTSFLTINSKYLEEGHLRFEQEITEFDHFH